jgi:Tfp pilus assembly protein FimT
MMEMMGAVAILVIVFALGIPSLFNLQKQLRMMELDAKAQQIYNAVQYRLSALQSSGKLSELSASLESSSTTTQASTSNTNDNGKFTTKPNDYTYDNYSDSGNDGSGAILYRFDETSSVVTDYLVTDDGTSISSALLQITDDSGAHFVIELSPSTGEVYSVYYWEGSDSLRPSSISIPDDVTSAYGTDYTSDRSSRTAYMLGYYQGGEVSSAIDYTASDTDTLSDLTYSIVNNEELYVSIQSKDITTNTNTTDNPYSLSILITGYTTDSGGSKKTILLTDGSNAPTPSSSYSYSDSDTVDLSKVSEDVVGVGNGEIDIILDSMRDDHDFDSITKGNFIPGTDITIEWVGVNYNDSDYTSDSTGTNAISWLASESCPSKTTNSLYESYSYDSSSAIGTVEVSNVRHLNNLRSSKRTQKKSEVEISYGIARNNFANVTVTNDIEYDGKKWQDSSVSVQSRYDGNTKRETLNPIQYENKLFEPIVMPSYFANGASVTSSSENYELSNFEIGYNNSANKDSGTGLFASATFNISYITMVNPSVKGGSNTGALVGIVNDSGAAKFESCKVITTNQNSDGSYDFATDSVSGTNGTGGLIGYSTSWEITLSNCSASIDVSGTTNVGGLVGYGPVIINNCSYGYDVANPSTDALPTVTATDVTATNSEGVGGLVGSLLGKSISSSKVRGNVSGNNNVGGLVGYLSSSNPSVSDCIVGYVNDTTGEVTTVSVTADDSSQNVGGLVGNQAGGSISGSQSFANVTAGDYSTNVGGLIGAALTTTGRTIENSYVGYKVSDAAVVSVDVKVGNSSTNVGGFIGVQEGGDISKSEAFANVTVSGASSTNIGGFVGTMSGGTITNCDVRGSSASSSTDGTPTWVKSDGSNIGGFAGQLTGGMITGSFAATYVSPVTDTSDTTTSSVGGFVGLVNASSSIKYCYSSGYVWANTYVGGFIGHVDYAPTISNSYSTSHVYANSYAGGFIGVLSNNGWLSNISSDYSYGLVTNYQGKEPSDTSTYGGFIGSASVEQWASWSGKGCGYLRQGWYRDLSASNQPGAYSYEELKKLATDVDSTGISHPYDASLSGQAFPFSYVCAGAIGTNSHYGNWPVEEQ